jgi:hypothetical protein
VGDKRFHDFTLSFQDSTSGQLPSYDQVIVSSLNDDPLNPGLRFTSNGQFSTIGTNLLSVEFGYSVSTLTASPLINGNTLTLDSHSFGSTGGNILISEDVADAVGGDLGNKIVEADQSNGLFDLMESISFAPQSSVRIVNAMTIGGDNPGDTVDLSIFSQRFSQVPEPAGLALAVTGLFVLAARRKPKRIFM